MLIEQQITERRERAAGAIAKILKRPTGAPYGDYSVKSASGKTTDWQCADQGYSKTTARVRTSASILWERVSTLKRCFCGCGVGTARRLIERAMRAHVLPSRCNM